VIEGNPRHEGEDIVRCNLTALLEDVARRSRERDVVAFGSSNATTTLSPIAATLAADGALP
jgi:hypothetical protein